MKLLFTSLFMLFSIFSYSQQKYPIQTVYKNDPVVIITLDQSIQINKLIDEQNKKISDLESIIYKDTKENGKLTNDISNMEEIIAIKNKKIAHLYDSLNYEHNKYLIALDNRDSATAYTNSLIDWLVDAAINNTFIYLDWNTYSVKMMDFNAYKTKKNIFGRYEFTHLNVIDKEYKKVRIKNKIMPSDLDKMDIIDCPIKINSIKWTE